ncbi:MAG TPA: Hsp70 family protein [Caulobacteraceae bacterium]|nr:Hsp70 family protein [Caulobacteraceae bacterium]
MSASAMTLGVDFGTTNTVVSLLGGGGEAELLRFNFDGQELTPFRSCLSFGGDESAPGSRLVEAGPWAIDAYLEDPGATRFIQSFKSFAASATFSETTILGRRYRFEDLLSTFLLRARAHAGAAMGGTPERLIVGRPVRFAGAYPDPALALQRYETAFRRLGFADIYYAYEPVAAAFFFARGIDADATALVGDFGGGTSDFSIVRFTRRRGVLSSKALGQAGVGVAGDAFDYRLIDQLVSPALGKGSAYRDFDNTAPIPVRYYASFARWDQLALMRATRDMSDIRGLVRKALEPEKIARLVEFLEGEYGYLLYQSISRLKEALSVQPSARFAFHAGDIALEADVERADFERWIARDLAAIDAAVDEALASAKLKPAAIDQVFLTGGSSFVPAVRALFEQRFGPEKISTGAELESIAAGLALIGGEVDLTPWCERA